MKNAELIGVINAGKIVLIGTMLHMKKEVIAYRGDGGKAMTFDKVQFSVLSHNGVVFVEPDTRKIPGFNMNTFVCPVEYGKQCVVLIDEIRSEKGVTTVRGTVEPLV